MKKRTPIHRHKLNFFSMVLSLWPIAAAAGRPFAPRNLARLPGRETLNRTPPG
jgi:hypothetical protein